MRTGTALVFSSTPAAFAAPGDSIKRTAPVERQEYADESGLKKYSYSNMPWEDLDKSSAKFSPKTNWNTLYPEKRLRLEKKSPVARRDLCGLRSVRAESSRRPPRHRRDACSIAWWCSFLTARPNRDGRAIAEKCTRRTG